MRNIITTGLLFVAAVLLGCQTTEPAPQSFTVDKNTIQVIGFMDESLMARPLAELQAVPDGGTAYLYIFSSAGDPRVAEKFVDAMEGKTTVCLTHAAGGGAFTIFQSCTYRLVAERSAMGSSKFQVRGTTGDPVKDQEFRDQAASLSEKFTEIESDRLGIDEEDYEKMLDAGFAWMTTEEVLKNKGADAQVEFRCAAGTQENTLTRTVVAQNFVFDIVVTQCPVPRKLVEPADAPGPELGEALGFPIHGNLFEGVEAEIDVKI
jgi:hypothetical protein